MKWILSIASALMAISVLAVEQSQNDPPMNILMIAVDDLNDWVGFMDGHSQTQTPNMDRLAAESMVFENAQCAAPSCNPSRTALMSGIAPHVSGIYSNIQDMRESPVLKDAIMLPRYFSNHGYTSMVRGKIFHHADMDPQTWDIMSNQNKDRLDVPKDQLTDMDPYQHIKADNALFSDTEELKGTKTKHRGRSGNLYWRSTMQPKELTKDYQNALWAAKWLTDSADQETPLPFFLACGIFRPHLSWVVPAEYFNRIDLDSIQLPPIKDDDLSDVSGWKPSKEYKHALKHDLRKEAVWAYLASIAYADDCIGVLLDALDKSPYRDNTIIVLWSDHGWHLGEKQRYKKFTLWEEGTHMPFIIKVPGMPAGRSTRPVSLIDLYPTLIDLAGLPSKDGLSGRSIKPLLQDPMIEWDFPALTSLHENDHSLRSERWRYIRYANGTEELYDHKNDPQEWTNQANNPEFKSIKQHLRALLPE